MNIDATLKKFQELGCYLNSSWVRGKAGSAGCDEERLYADLLCTDFHSPGVIERGSLDGVDLLTSSTQDGTVIQSKSNVKGPCMVQVDMVLDVGEGRGPDRYVLGGPGSSSPSRGALKLTCFDGKRSFFLVEKKPMFGKENGGVPRPGAKLVLKNIRARRGLLMLEEGTVALLGGSVPAQEDLVKRLHDAEDARINRKKVEPPAAAPQVQIRPALNTSSGPVVVAKPVAPVKVPQPLVLPQSKPPPAATAAAACSDNEIDLPGSPPPPVRRRVVDDDDDVSIIEPPSLPPSSSPSLPAKTVPAPVSDLEYDEDDLDVDELLMESHFREREEEGRIESDSKEKTEKKEKAANVEDVVILASSPETPPSAKEETEPKFMSLKEAATTLNSSDVVESKIVVKAVVTDVVSSFACSDGEFTLDIKIEDGSSGATVTLSSNVLESFLGTTPKEYSALEHDSEAERVICSKLQSKLASLEGLFTLTKHESDNHIVAVSVEQVSIEYHLFLQQRVNTKPHSATALEEMINKIS